MSFWTVFFAVLLAILVATALKLILSMIFAKTNAPNPMMVPGPKPQITDVLSEITMLIRLECVGCIDIPQSVKAIPLITDFHDIQMEIIHNVVESLSTGFWLYANRAGLTRKYIVTYITRQTHAELLDFMDKHNYSMTSPNGDAEK